MYFCRTQAPGPQQRQAEVGEGGFNVRFSDEKVFYTHIHCSLLRGSVVAEQHFRRTGAGGRQFPSGAGLQAKFIDAVVARRPMPPGPFPIPGGRLGPPNRRIERVLVEESEIIITVRVRVDLDAHRLMDHLANEGIN